MNTNLPQSLCPSLSRSLSQSFTLCTGLLAISAATTLPMVARAAPAWPDKPITTQSAVDFNIAATGIATSASSPGLFAEAYWNYGWTGVILLMMPLGLLLALLSRYAIDVFHRESWLYFPVVLLAMRIGFRTDGYYVPDILGALVILISLQLVLYLLDRFELTLFKNPMIRPV